jgi:hypothetical protein
MKDDYVPEFLGGPGFLSDPINKIVFIELTYSCDGSPLHIRRDHIIGLHLYPAATRVTCTCGTVFQVRETPEEVMKKIYEGGLQKWANSLEAR